jgi:hypothetical protein
LAARIAPTGTPWRCEITLNVSPGITRTVTEGFWTDGAPTMGAMPFTAVKLEQAQAGSMNANAKTARVELRSGDLAVETGAARNESMCGLEQRGANSVLWLPFE